ncbi:MAG TPA: PSD1 and planctomycete cytochrome C domain-containing protein [Gemmataceae bacterium]|nr:PSD1 and planctomycete cytochrome C domain-containing protein [Gemmataceae bacterium]
MNPTRLSCLATVLVAASAPAADPTADEFFEASVRPVLVEACGKCHGPAKQHGGLRLDSRAAVLSGGDHGPAIVPGKPADSRLIAAVRRAGELKMPPDKPLADKHVAALVRWVELGAPWPADRGPAKTATPTEHWAFKPVRTAEPPVARDASWVRTPIDRFLLAKLEAEGLSPSPAADKRTLIRRATYDLTGLPPTPAEVDAFVNDSSPDAYRGLIDRLLKSPHYGEQWGRHWLDVARYSDTKGYVYAREERVWVHAWAYRDWVVKALNDDMPYDRFLTLQLAADLVEPANPAARAAMGYLTLNRRFLGVTHDIIDDRIDVVGRGMLGLTVACARCHDHKFDPIPTADYYSLYGVFRNCVEHLVPATDAAPDPDGAFAKGLRERQKKLDDLMARRRRETADRARERVGDYLQAQLELQKYPEEGFDQILAPDDLIPATVRRWRDYLARPKTKADPVFAAWFAYTDSLSRLSRSERAPFRSAEGDSVNPLVAKAFATPPKDKAEVVKRYAELFDRARVRKPFLGIKPEWYTPPEPGLDAFRAVLYGPDSPCEVPDEPIVNSEAFFPTKFIEELWKFQAEVDRWLIQRADAPAYAVVLNDAADPVNARVFRRGNPAAPGAEVPRQFLGLLAGPDRKPFATGSGRLELARAIADPKNPLTARVMVNRVWMHHFGAGLVRTPSDFGTRAEPPSHPELLDYLAAKFVAGGWSLKTLHREIMQSAAYQQTSSVAPHPKDPENRWLSRMNARRLSFEELKDSLFAMAGELSPKVGGKPGDLLSQAVPARRALYGQTDRQFPQSVLATFDVANPDLHIPQRPETTVPQQALFFLNHPLLLARAKAMATHATVTAAPTPEAKVQAMYRLAYQRDPTPPQVRAAVELVRAIDADVIPPPPAAPSAWKYGVGAYDPKTGKLSGFTPLPHFNGESWQGAAAWPDPKFGWARVTAAGGHPGNDLAHAVVRRWTAPADGAVRIAGTLTHEEAAGDGVRASIVNNRHGRLKTATAHNSKAKMDVAKVEVKAGDTIDFVVDILGELNTDQYLWAPTITLGDKEWDAKAEFTGPTRPGLTGLEQLAQALIMANEFMFVD